MQADTRPSPRKGLVLVICAPSGTGKSTLVRRLMQQFPDFAFSVSYTTRQPRSGEKNGREYHFVDRERFLCMQRNGEFAEWAEVHGNFYGTARRPVEELLAAGRDVLFDIDVQGARQLRDVFRDGLFVFILPPSRPELERRLAGRGTDAAEVIARRLGNARGEIEAAPGFDYWIVNDDLDRACDELRAVYLAGRVRAASRPRLVEDLLTQWRDHG